MYKEKTGAVFLTMYDEDNHACIILYSSSIAASYHKFTLSFIIDLTMRMLAATHAITDGYRGKKQKKS